MAGARYEPENCAFCRNTGKINPGFLGLDTKICPVCKGQGSVLVAQPAKRCAYCNGKGKTFPAAPCPACKGSGWAHLISTKSR